MSGPQDRQKWLPRAVTGSAVGTALAYMLVAGIASSIMHIGVRWLGPQLPVFEIVLLRAVVTALVTVPFLLHAGTRLLRTKRLDLQLWRGLVASASITTWYYALTTIPLADAGALSFTTVLFVTIGAALYFRETVGWRRWTAVLAGLVGAIIVLRPGAGIVSWGAIAALVSSALWAVAMLQAKELGRWDESLTITFYQPILIIPIALIGAVPVWVTPSAEALAIVLVMGLLAFVANYGYIRAMKLADASVVMPVDYLRLVWMTMWGYMLFSELPDLATGIGAALIIGATFFITVRERQVAAERAREANQ